MGNAASKGSATKKNANKNRESSPTKSGNTRKANGPTFEDRLAEQQALRNAEKAARNAKRNAERAALAAKRNAEKADRNAKRNAERAARNAERATLTAKRNAERVERNTRRNAERAARNAKRIVNAAERKKVRNAQIEVFKEECKAEAKEAKKTFIENWKVQLAGEPIPDEILELADTYESNAFTACYTGKLLNMQYQINSAQLNST